MNNVIEVKGLTKQFLGKKPFLAVNNLNFSVAQGEIVGLLGPNGAGKSTTIQMLLDVLTPSSGEIRYFGKDLKTHRTAIMEQVGFGNGYGKLPWNLTAWENLMVQGMLYGLKGNDLKSRAEELLTRFGMIEKRKRLCGVMSAGEATRVMLAKAFIARPKVVLLDEPTAALDPEICVEIRRFVLEQQREYGVSMIYTSHNMIEVAEICDRVIFLKKGEIVAFDTPKQLAAKAALAKLKLRFKERERAELQLRTSGLEIAAIDGWTSIELDEHRIAETLIGLAQSGLHYDALEIERPTLEDYFLLISKQQREHESV